MTKRYGRNQKRRHVARIAELEKQVSGLDDMVERLRRDRAKAESEATMHRITASQAREKALTDAIKNMHIYKRALEMMAEAMGRKLGDELRPHAERILAAERSMARFDVEIRPDHVLQCDVIQGAIPAIGYRFMMPKG